MGVVPRETDRPWPMKGTAHPNAKLKNAHVRAIRALYAETPILQRELAVQFGITRQAVNLIVNRVNWSHL